MNGRMDGSTVHSLWPPENQTQSFLRYFENLYHVRVQDKTSQVSSIHKLTENEAVEKEKIVFL